MNVVSGLLSSDNEACQKLEFESMPFWISSAPEIYQKRMSETLEGIEGVVCHMDDVFVHGMNQNLLDTRLEAVLQKLKETGITLNAEKCEYPRTPICRFIHSRNNTHIFHSLKLFLHFFH
jgi:hypothetical protein